MTVSTPPVGPERAYFEALQRQCFQIQKCRGCRQHVFYPRVLCPHCGSDALEWIEPSGRGTVYSATTVRRKPEAGGDYNVALIELEEGPRMMSRVEEVAPDQVRIGMNVQATFTTEEGKAILVFVPAAMAR